MDSDDRGREWLRTTLYSIGDAVITTDAMGRVREMNPVAEALTGWPEAEAAGRTFAEIFVALKLRGDSELRDALTRSGQDRTIISCCRSYQRRHEEVICTTYLIQRINSDSIVNPLAAGPRGRT